MKWNKHKVSDDVCSVRYEPHEAMLASGETSPLVIALLTSAPYEVNATV
jgi:hypothetical protein